MSVCMSVYLVVHKPFSQYITLRQLGNQERLIHIFGILWTMLETLRLFDPREKDEVRRMTFEVIEKLIYVLTVIKKNVPEFFDAYIIKTSLELITARSEFSRFTLDSLLRLVIILTYVPPKLLNDDMMETFSQLIRRDWWDNPGLNLLHGVCLYSCDRSMDLYAVVRLLLLAGSNPNPIDKDGNTPLHFLIELNRNPNKPMNLTARLLIDFGAKLSIKNKNGNTVVDLWRQMNTWRKRRLDKDDVFAGDDLPDWCLELPTLTCLSARVIRCYRIPHLELPATLISIIEKYKIIL